MTVKIGSARIDEKGGAHGGRAGDQTGRELSTQNWYLHSKGWRVYRAISPDVAERIAQAMERACANPHIGYDQYQRNSLYKEAAQYGYDPEQVTKDVETDCSALVRVCCAYAGIMGLPADFRTGNMPANLAKTGAFTELTGAKYQSQSTYLGRGDILVTKTNGHTVVVLTNGPKYEGCMEPVTYNPGDRILRHGCDGKDVQIMQEMLLQLGYSLGKYGTDGDFGDCTQMALEAFQSAAGLAADGECGPTTWAALNKAVGAITTGACGDVCPIFVTIQGGNCYVRTAPNTEGKIIGVAHSGDMLSYGGQISDGGWLLVSYDGQNGWVSGKYGKLVE